MSGVVHLQWNSWFISDNFSQLWILSTNEQFITIIRTYVKQYRLQCVNISHQLLLMAAAYLLLPLLPMSFSIHAEADNVPSCRHFR